MRRLLVFAYLSLFVSFGGIGDALAQEPESEDLSKSDTEDTKDNSRTYVKLGYRIANRSIYDFPVSIGGVEIEIEKYFSKNQLGLSGWTLGYRKEDIRYVDGGHLFNLRIFREINFLHIGGGVEAGMVSLEFDRTRFTYDSSGEPTAYEHMFPRRDMHLSRGRRSLDLGVYPFLELSLVQRSKFLLEIGLRTDMMRFGFNEYSSYDSNLVTNFRNDFVIVPAVFVRVGFGSKSNSK